MFEEVLPKNAKESLAILGKSRLLREIYLAGGTALALQLGHRHSYDLDFFTPKPFQAKSMAQKIVKLLPKFRIERTAWRTIYGRIGTDKFTMFYYEYPLLFPPKKFMDVALADARDIAAMKVAAVADRGTKRDFIDLYFLFRQEGITLAQALQWYGKKYKLLRSNFVHIMKSLSYFIDADADEMPAMLKPVRWPEVKKFFERETQHAVKARLREKKI